MKQSSNFISINTFSCKLGKYVNCKNSNGLYGLILIEEGKGKYLLNDLELYYKKGNLFLLSPNDIVEFQIKSPTKFIYFKFTEQLLIEKSDGIKSNYWHNLIESIILQVQHNMLGNTIQSIQDTKSIIALMHIIKREYNQEREYTREVVLELVGVIMIIIARNIDKRNFVTFIGKVQEKEKINSILSHIQLLIHSNKKISITLLANRFAIAKNYISTYVKKQIGVSIREYVNEKKMSVAEELLKQGKLNINEIADRLGFIDASHFYKFFLKRHGISPGQYKKNSD